jgi:hypothetical protein
MKAKVRMKFKGNLKLSVRRIILLAEQVLFKLLLKNSHEVCQATQEQFLIKIYALTWVL